VYSNMRLKSIALRNLPIIILALATILIIAGCGQEKVITRYAYPPSPVSLIYPMVDSIVTSSNPTFLWHKVAEATKYHLQVAKISDFVSTTINTQISDTSHTAVTSLIDDTYYWRVRAQDANGVWGDWSDSEIRIFYKSGTVNYVTLLSQTLTNGSAQDVFVSGDTAYVADGQADLSMFDISNPASPRMVLNIDTGDDDFAKGVYVLGHHTPEIDTFPFAYVADMDGKIQALNTRDPNSTLSLSFGTDQNLEDICGIAKSDTLWILAVSSGFNRRKLSFWKIIYDPSSGGGPNPFSYFYQIDMPADAYGVCADSAYAYVACGSSGIRIVSIADIYNPIVISELAIGGTALSVDVKDSTLYVAADRAGLFAINLGSDRLNPTIVHQVNTVGRTKDLQIVGNYAFLADANGGLKVVDISVPAACHVVATYVTPYAYGVWADSDHVFICDRDYGLLIFTNLISQ
jgi:hypothetical protein